VTGLVLTVLSPVLVAVLRVEAVRRRREGERDDEEHARWSGRLVAEHREQRRTPSPLGWPAP
jgi:hypothetical protein